MKYSIIILSFFVLFFTACQPVKKTKMTKVDNNKIKVAVFEGNGASPTCVIETYEALKIDTGIRASILHATDIMQGKLKKLDVLIFPGGSASKELNNMGEQAAAKVLDFVKEQGKGLVGICAGGYLFSTTKGYPSLRLVSATEWDRAHYDKGRALVQFKPTEKGLEIFPELKGQSCFLQYYDGPVLMPADSGKSGKLNYIELGKFVTDIHVHKSYPAGITPDKTFLLAEKVGKGRTIVSAGHPEATPGMRWMVARMARWAAKKKLVSYNKKWIRPEINNKDIQYRPDLVKIEKNLFWQLFNDTTQVRINAMQKLYEMRSRPAVRWNIGLLRSKKAKVRAKAAELLMQAEYTAAVPDLKEALATEQNEQAKESIKKAINFLTTF